MSRIALDLGFIQIYWYSIMIALGLLAGVIVILREAKRLELSEDFFVNLIFWGVIYAIIGARLYYVAFNWDYYSQHFMQIFEIWNGGLAIHGGMIGGGLFSLIYAKRNKIDVLKVIDVIVVGLIIGQAVGRWGNFFNQEAYGGIVSLDYLEGMYLPQFIIDGMKIGINYYHPTFLYESLWNLVGFVILLMVRRIRYIHTGQITGLYMIWYGVGRFVIEGFRTDSLMLGDVRMAQLVSVVMVGVGIILFVIRIGKSRFDNRYNAQI